jgi:hypothetical protein
MKEFTSACRTMKPLVEFTTKALGLKFQYCTRRVLPPDVPSSFPSGRSGTLYRRFCPTQSPEPRTDVLGSSIERGTCPDSCCCLGLEHPLNQLRGSAALTSSTAAFGSATSTISSLYRSSRKSITTVLSGL